MGAKQFIREYLRLEIIHAQVNRFVPPKCIIIAAMRLRHPCITREIQYYSVVTLCTEVSAIFHE